MRNNNKLVYNTGLESFHPKKLENYKAKMKIALDRLNTYKEN